MKYHISSLFRKNRKFSGFTIVELLVVIIVIGILATLVVVSYNGIQDQGTESAHNADQQTVYKAILAARLKTGDTLAEITENTCTSCRCWDESPTEPKDLPKSHDCWQEYYDAIDAIGDASGINLSGLEDGDARGNPAFLLDENEGEYPADPCDHDGLSWWTGEGTEDGNWIEIPLSLPECT